MATCPLSGFCTPRVCAGPRSLARKNTSGFSLIEILIATAILLVIVVMVSMVFQQQSAAFQSGTDRVKGQAAIRNVVGMIVRDLSLAVDSEPYESLGIEKNSFSGSTLSFLATTGEAGIDADGKSVDGVLPLQRVTYSGNGVIKREVQSYKLNDSGKWVKAGRSSANINNSDSSVRISYEASESSSSLPSNIVIRASFAGSSSASSVIGMSAGPDGKWDSDDDIYVGGKP